MAAEKKHSQKTQIESKFGSGGEMGAPGEAGKIAEALASANAKFFEALKAAGVKPLDGEGSFDRGGCGHDRS